MLKFKNITQDLPVTQAVKHNLEYLLTKIPYTYKEMINLESIGVEDNKVVLLWINDFDEFLSVVIGEQPTFLINFNDEQKEIVDWKKLVTLLESLFLLNITT